MVTSPEGSQELPNKGPWPTPLGKILPHGFILLALNPPFLMRALELICDGYHPSLLQSPPKILFSPCYVDPIVLPPYSQTPGTPPKLSETQNLLPAGFPTSGALKTEIWLPLRTSWVEFVQWPTPHIANARRVLSMHQACNKYLVTNSRALMSSCFSLSLWNH